MKKVVLSDADRCKLQELELDILLEVDRICKLYDIKYTLAYGTMLGAVRHKGFIPWDDDVDICMLRDDYNRFRNICKSELNPRFFYQSNETDQEYFYLFNKIRINNTIFKEAVLSSYNINHGVYIDIFPVDNIPESKLSRNVQFLKFHFYRTGLMAKYLDINARTGWKKYAASILKVLYLPWSVKQLYKGACNSAQMYDDKPLKTVSSFYSPYKKKDIFPISFFENLKECEFENHSFLISENYDNILRALYGQYIELPPVEKRITQHDLVEIKL